MSQLIEVATSISDPILIIRHLLELVCVDNMCHLVGNQ